MKSQCEHPEIRIKVMVPCRLGLNLQVASRVVRLARRYKSDIFLKAERLKADAKSLLSIILLGSTGGTSLEIVGCGADADHAVRAISDLFESKEVLCKD